MSNSSKGGSLLFNPKRFLQLCKPTDSDKVEREVEAEMDDEEKGDFFRGGGEDESPNKMSDDDRPDNLTRVREGWKDKIDNRVKENAKTSRENKKILAMVDERTSIIMRLMFALLIAMVVGVAVGITVQFVVA